MATAHPESYEEISSGSGSDESDSDGNSDVETDEHHGKEACKYYNGKGCKDGDKCSYLHMCKYALRGSCRDGAHCKMKHPRAKGDSSGGSNKALDRSASRGSKLTDGRLYQWQLSNGNGWLDVGNDHILEAQYSLPHTKSIKIYNTKFGAVSMDFNRMRVFGKNLKVRRLDDEKTVWIWYCTLRRKWTKYGDKDSKGIEQQFQKDPSSSHTFAAGADKFEIKFRDMQQVTAKKKRKVTRRPLYRSKVPSTALNLQNLSLTGKCKWQFEGDSGAWHDFKVRDGCSVGSAEIEGKYVQNPTAGMTFKVKATSYKLDFQAMTQLNLKTNKCRKIRRV